MCAPTGLEAFVGVGELDCAVLVFDLTRLQLQDPAVTSERLAVWKETFARAAPGKPVVLVGAKADKVVAHVPTDVFPEAPHVIWASAVTGEGIETIIAEITKNIRVTEPARL